MTPKSIPSPRSLSWVPHSSLASWSLHSSGGWKLLSRVQLFVILWTISPWNSPGQNTGVGSLSLLQGIFPTQGLNSVLLHLLHRQADSLPPSHHVLLVQSQVMSSSLRPHGLQHIRLPSPSLSPGVCSNSCPLSSWCHPTISFSVTASPPTFNLSQHQDLFQWVDSLHQVAKVLELLLQHQSFQINIQGWFPLGLTGLILLSEGLSRVFSNTTVQKHQFFST